MAQEKATGAKTLEMRVAALEDKLSQLNVTEEEMAAYQKVSSLMGTSAGSAAGNVAFTPNPEPSFCQPIVRYRGWPVTRTPIIHNSWNECQPIGRGGMCALCDPASGGGGGAGFGGFGF